MVDYQNVFEVLEWLSGPVGAVAWFIFVSNLVRNAREDDALKNWTSWQVQHFVAGVSLVVPVGAILVNTYVSPDVLAGIQEYYAAISAIAIAYLGQQAWYKATKYDGGNPG